MYKVWQFDLEKIREISILEIQSFQFYFIPFTHIGEE